MTKTEVQEKIIEEQEVIIERLTLEVKRLRANSGPNDMARQLLEERNQLKRDVAFLMGALGVALRQCSTVVLRPEDMKNLPEIEQFENISDELCIRIKRKNAPVGAETF